MNVSGKEFDNFIFLHIPKSGGSTFHQIIERQFYNSGLGMYTIKRTRETPQFLELSEQQRNKIKVLKGHMLFGLHEYLEGKSVYVSMLRDPVERMVSAYYYAKSHETHDRYEYIHQNKLNLYDYVNKDQQEWLYNTQTKYLAGAENINSACNQAIYDKAIEHVERYFLLLGLTERFDETMLLLRRMLHWRWPCYVKANITKNKPKKSLLTEEERQIIQYKNQYDMKLYEWASKRFDHLAQQNKLKLKLDKKIFSLLNIAYSKKSVGNES